MVMMQFKASVTVPDADGPERYDITLVYRSFISVSLVFSRTVLSCCWEGGISRKQQKFLPWLILLPQSFYYHTNCHFFWNSKQKKMSMASNKMFSWIYLLCILGHFEYWVSFFMQFFMLFKIKFVKKIIQDTIRMSISFDPDEAKHFVRPFLGLNCLLR